MRLARFLSLASVVALAACSAGPREIAVQTPVAPQPRPVPPAGAAPGLTIPVAAADGRHVTPNSNLSANEAVWHLRMALNVAALLCRAPDDAPRVQYNQFLSLHKATLAKANLTVDSEYKGRYGAQAINIRDKRNTTVYNFFAQPPAQDGFCAAAIAVGAAADATPSAQLAAFAPAALQTLEQPFQDFYRAYADYQRRLAAWSSGTMQPAVAATPARLDVDLSVTAMNDEKPSQKVVYPQLARSR